MYAACGTPTTTPNGVRQNTAGWSTLVKQAKINYAVLADGKWCDNQGGAQGHVVTRVSSLESCKTACTGKGSSCSYLSFDSHNSWCAMYAACGTPTTTPNGVRQNTAGWSTLVKQAKINYAVLADGKWCDNQGGAQGHVV